jgi:UPF0716 family protein affecting phage T7 exclusion
MPLILVVFKKPMVEIAGIVVRVIVSGCIPVLFFIVATFMVAMGKYKTNRLMMVMMG